MEHPNEATGALDWQRLQHEIHMQVLRNMQATYANTVKGSCVFALNATRFSSTVTTPSFALACTYDNAQQLRGRGTFLSFNSTSSPL